MHGKSAEGRRARNEAQLEPNIVGRIRDSSCRHRDLSRFLYPISRNARFSLGKLTLAGSGGLYAGFRCLARLQAPGGIPLKSKREDHILFDRKINFPGLCRTPSSAETPPRTLAAGVCAAARHPGRLAGRLALDPLEGWRVNFREADHTSTTS